MVAAASRSRLTGLSIFKLWRHDAGTFPIVFIASSAAVAAAAVSARYLMKNPDVCIDKTKRENTMHYDSQVGEKWRERRFRIANIKRNPINQSHQFDDLFAKEKNQSVSR
jgi:hypothetical protein